MLIRCRFPAACSSTLEIFDAAGSRVRRLASGGQPAGARTYGWDGRDDGGRRVPAGIYLARLETEWEVATGKLVMAW